MYCGAARALDVVGDRWTLLIVHELMLGPQRFTDLIDGLPGISRNLLTERLRSLEQDGIFAREELPPPDASFRAHWAALAMGPSPTERPPRGSARVTSTCVASGFGMDDGAPAARVRTMANFTALCGQPESCPARAAWGASQLGSGGR